MFENRALRGIFESYSEEVTGGWRILYDKRLHNFCPEPNMIIK
jgi:hypothetical protein